ncbi:MAG TPA: Crp/Fnr family transcriptional regulator [Pyrinomonadaceae bacterium]
MNTPEASSRRISNHILAALSPDERENLSRHFEYVNLSRGQAVVEPDESIRDVYFPCGALVSLVSLLSDGSTAEVNIVGRDGLVGLPAILGVGRTPMRAVVLIPGAAVKVRADVLRAAFGRGGALQSRILRYTHAALFAASQSAVCNSHHPVDSRLARWLLASSDGAESNDLPVTHELIASLLGVRRAGITCAAMTLREDELISYNRGHITVIDRPGLEAVACECYRAIRGQLEHLTGNGSGLASSAFAA